MILSNPGKGLIASFEAIYLHGYRDSAGVITIGIGHTAAAGGYAPKLSDRITFAQAIELFETRIGRYGREVDVAIKRNKPQYIFDAFTSAHFNTGAIRSGTIDDRWNRGDEAGALAVLNQYVNAGGKRLAGLVTRRQIETQLIRTGVYPARTVLVKDTPSSKGRVIAAASIPWGVKPVGLPVDPWPVPAAGVPVIDAVPATGQNGIVNLAKWLWGLWK